MTTLSVVLHFVNIFICLLLQIQMLFQKKYCDILGIMLYVFSFCWDLMGRLIKLSCVYAKCQSDHLFWELTPELKSNALYLQLR